MTKCPNSFTCEICKKDYHRATPKAQQLAEHQARKKTVAGYDDGEDTVEVCDPCFQQHVLPNMIPSLLPIGKG